MMNQQEHFDKNILIEIMNLKFKSFWVKLFIHIIWSLLHNDNIYLLRKIEKAAFIFIKVPMLYFRF